jgi:hypothetical protein
MLEGVAPFVAAGSCSGSSTHALLPGARSSKIPFHAAANYEIALACLDAGDRAQALEHLRRAVHVRADADPAHALGRRPGQVKQLESAS